MPVKVGAAKLAFRPRSVVKFDTPDSGSPVALVRVNEAGVPRADKVAGRVTVPVNVGEATGAFNPIAVLRSVWSVSVPVIAPQAPLPPVAGVPGVTWAESPTARHRTATTAFKN